MCNQICAVNYLCEVRNIHVVDLLMVRLLVVLCIMELEEGIILLFIIITIIINFLFHPKNSLI